THCSTGCTELITAHRVSRAATATATPTGSRLDKTAAGSTAVAPTLQASTDTAATAAAGTAAAGTLAPATSGAETSAAASATSRPTMAAYVISEVEVLEEDSFEQYRSLAKVSIEKHGGRYLVRAALPEAAEGDWPPQRRLVILEFPDMETVR